ncbi:myrosinase 1-like [Culicoides brevitarsis]|uniref:myrosinase 1-like n=1 Tax=Culicoides brevitarsis TaxID=469753 RepID=UPI00307C244B
MQKLPFLLFILNFLTSYCWINDLPKCDIKSGTKFPKDFLFGASTSSYQIEGAWNVSGKGENIWDHYLHKYPDRVLDHSNADVTADSYHLYREDIKALKDTGFNFYRFSISWARIMPNGSVASLNADGIDYYHRLIDALKEKGIEPLVTMYHWDLPLTLQEFGGFLNRSIADYFESYADFLFKEYGYKVQYWNTFNEPLIVCVPSYELGQAPPFIEKRGDGAYQCGHNLLLSHARAYHLYQKKYKSTQKGKIGIAINGEGALLKSNTTSAWEAFERKHAWDIGWYAHPIFSKTGNYPPIMISSVAQNSIAEGYNKSRLPEFTKAEIESLRGSADFLGLNCYSSRIIELGKRNNSEPASIFKDRNIEVFTDPSWKRAKTEWLYSVPEGFREMMHWLSTQYKGIEIWVTENGWSDDGQLNDLDRIEYYSEHLRVCLQSISCDNVNLKAFTAWSIIDNFEWMKGFTEKFGLYQVNFNSTKKERTAKMSAYYFRDIINSHAWK